MREFYRMGHDLFPSIAAFGESALNGVIAHTAAARVQGRTAIRRLRSIVSKNPFLKNCPLDIQAPRLA